MMDQLSGFIYLADDTKLIFVQFKPIMKSGGESGAKDADEKQHWKNLGPQ